MQYENPAKLMSLRMRMLLGCVIVSAVLMLIALATSAPFYFESSSMLYKFGTDKVLLRSGKILGLIAACLVVMQSVLSARIKFLDRIFALNNLMIVHRVSGIAIVCCGLTHPALMFIPEDMNSIPVSFRYWPEYVGVFLLLTIFGIVSIAILRLKINLAFDRWRTMHQWAVFTAAIVLFIHVLSVSETFEKGLPRIIVFFVIGVYVLLFVKKRLTPFIIRKKPFWVSEVSLAAKDAFQVIIKPDFSNTFSWLPGQFGFISFKSAHISSEAHPFTIASSPLHPDNLEFVIRACGDWTKKISQVQLNDPVYIHGPFGLFTHLRCKNKPEIIMIAGGIGITPMLSMLRFMADTGDQRNITLIWSNRTRDHIVFPDEFTLLEKKLANLRIVHVFTKGPVDDSAADSVDGPAADPAADSGENKKNKRLDQSGLEILLLNCSRQSAVFVCGPPKMMTDIRKALVGIGFSRHSIFTERFSL